MDCKKLVIPDNLGSSSIALSKLLIVSTLLSDTTSRTTMDVVEPARPTLEEPTEVIPTSAKFFRPAG